CRRPGRSPSPAGSDLARYFPATLELCLLAMAIGLVVGISLGMLSALFKDQWLDHITRIFAVSGIALPPFWFGLLLQLGFAVWLGWLPTSGRMACRPTRAIRSPACCCSMPCCAATARCSGRA
ncbi:MAG TPA: ABC transporter permease, partial [Reyranella sp.]|nr:ABC transporter permease [Reyranella sp.]